MLFVQIFHTTFQANSPAGSALCVGGFVAYQTIVVHLLVRAEGHYSDKTRPPLIVLIYWKWDVSQNFCQDVSALLVVLPVGWKWVLGFHTYLPPSILPSHISFLPSLQWDPAALWGCWGLAGGSRNSFREREELWAGLLSNIVPVRHGFQSLGTAMISVFWMKIKWAKTLQAALPRLAHLIFHKM